MVTLIGGEEDFFYPEVNFSLRVWSFSGSAVSEAAANNLRNSGHISQVPSALIEKIPAVKKSQDNLFQMESWRKLSQNLSVGIGCVFMEGKLSFLTQTQNPWPSMR